MATREPIHGLVDMAVAAEWLNVPYTWLRDKVTARAVVCTRLGKHVRFSQDDLDAIVAANKQAVATAPNRATVRAIRAGAA
jgi:excisionase family DNA binding protein